MKVKELAERLYHLERCIERVNLARIDKLEETLQNANISGVNETVKQRLDTHTENIANLTNRLTALEESSGKSFDKLKDTLGVLKEADKEAQEYWMSTSVTEALKKADSKLNNRLWQWTVGGKILEVGFARKYIGGGYTDDYEDIPYVKYGGKELVGGYDTMTMWGAPHNEQEARWYAEGAMSVWNKLTDFGKEI